MKIGFDMDSVLAYDMVIQWSKKLQERYPHETLGRDWTQIKTYDLNQTYPLLSREKLFGPVKEKGFFLNLTPERYASEVINITYANPLSGGSSLAATPKPKKSKKAKGTNEIKTD